MPAFWENVVWFGCLFFGSFTIYAFTSRLIFDTKILVDINSPSSFFSLDEIISTVARRNIIVLFTLPLVLLFLAVSTSSATVKAAQELISNYLVSVAPTGSGQSVKSLINSLDGPLAPLFVLLISLLLFAPYIRKILEQFASLVIKVSGYRKAVDDGALGFASTILKAREFYDVQSAVGEKLEITLPIPEELSSCGERNILAYQILYIKNRVSPSESMADFLASFPINILEFAKVLQQTSPDTNESVKTHKSEDEPNFNKIITVNNSIDNKKMAENIDREPIAIHFIFFSIIIYAVLCLLYLTVVPQFSTVIAPNWPQQELGPIEWPLPQYWSTLGYSILQRTVSFVLTLAAGYYIFSLRRKLKKSESALLTYFYTASIQFMMSIFANIVFVAIVLAKKDQYEFGYDAANRTIPHLTIACELITYSLIPSILLGFSVICANINYSKLTTIIILSFVGSISFFLSQILNEIVTDHYIGYYWHQLLLGFYMTIAYFVAAMLFNDVTFIKTELNPSIS